MARLISWVEDGDRDQLRDAAEALNPSTGRAQVIGLTGSPGVGKSTLAGALVAAYRAQGLTVGVLAVDPSSPFTGGALLGDRVRMQRHALDDGVYIRSMATRGHLGGLAWATPQAVRVLDAAGCDVVLVETVGVGQAEVEVAAPGRHHPGRPGPRLRRRRAGRQGRHPRGGRRVRGQQGRPRRRRGGRPRPPPDAPPGRGHPLAGPGAPDRGRARRRGRPAGRRPSAPTAPTWPPAASWNAAAATGPPARSRRSPWPTSAPSSASSATAKPSTPSPTRSPPASSAPTAAADQLLAGVRGQRR